jgi:hypothetical protein
MVVYIGGKKFETVLHARVYVRKILLEQTTKLEKLQRDHDFKMKVLQDTFDHKVQPIKDMLEDYTNKLEYLKAIEMGKIETSLQEESK